MPRRPLESPFQVRAGLLLIRRPPEIARTELTETLVADLKARHPEALGELLRQHGPEIQAVAFLIVRNERDAEEILADTLLTAWRKIDSLRDPTRLRSWLLTTATRLALRRRRRFQPHLLSLDSASNVAADEPSPINRLALGQAIKGLPPRMRAVVALHYVADLPTAEIAAVVGRSENTVKTQLREARAKLRAALADDAPEKAALDQKEPT